MQINEAAGNQVDSADEIQKDADETEKGDNTATLPVRTHIPAEIDEVAMTDTEFALNEEAAVPPVLGDCDDSDSKSGDSYDDEEFHPYTLSDNILMLGGVREHHHWIRKF